MISWCLTTETKYGKCCLTMQLIVRAMSISEFFVVGVHGSVTCFKSNSNVCFMF